MLLHISPLIAPRLPFVSIIRTSVAPNARRLAISQSRILRFAAFGVAGLGTAAYFSPRVRLEPTSRPASPVPVSTPPAQVPVEDSKPAPPPESSLAPVELSFGLVCGICAGVFVKKGAKAIAFTVGGIFVLLQYLSLNSYVRVDWARIGSKFEQLFYRTDPVSGKKSPPTLGSLYNWLVNFLATDFQPRAAFIAGLALGIRVG